jgi:hypothetical protein
VSGERTPASWSRSSSLTRAAVNFLLGVGFLRKGA